MNYFWNEKAELSKQVDSFFEYLAKVNDTRFDGQLTIVLLGSMSRGEATWTYEKGKFQIISDLEFFTIYPSSFSNNKAFEAEIQNGKNLFFVDQDSILFHIDNTFICLEDIPKLPRKVITYDTKNMGKVVVGNKQIIDLFPSVSLENINREDIWDIMVHRLFYVLYYGDALKQSKQLHEYRYTIAKNALDLMTVILASHNIINTGFNAKLESIKELNLSKEYKDFFSYCLDIKFNNSAKSEYEISQMEEIFIKIIYYCQLHFKVGLANRVSNIRFILKRRLGIIKRMISCRQITFGRKHFLKKLINVYNTDRKLSKSMIKESFVLNSYPKL